MQDKVANLIIIGSGPAGLTAALYASRAGLAPRLVEGESPGGQPMMTAMIENFPGFPKGISGVELISRMREQAGRFGAKFLNGQVTRVDFKKKIPTVFIKESQYKAKSVIIATGANPRWLGVPGEDKFKGRGVSVCATCDGFFYRDKVVAVVGGGDSALEEAVFLTRFAKKVVIVHRRDKLRASKLLQERARAQEKIEFFWDTVVEKIKGNKLVEGLELRGTKTGEASSLACSGVFIAIGHEPNTKIFENQLNLDQKGYVKAKSFVETNIEGIFAAGDVADPHFRQAITASATGCMAAMMAEEYLARQ